MSSGRRSEDWSRAYTEASKLSGTSYQKAYLQLLAEPIPLANKQQIRERRVKMSDLAETIPKHDAKDLLRQLQDPSNPLGQLHRLELHHAVQRQIERKLKGRSNGHDRGLGSQSRGIDDAKPIDDKPTNILPNQLPDKPKWSLPIIPDFKFRLKPSEPEFPEPRKKSRPDDPDAPVPPFFTDFDFELPEELLDRLRKKMREDNNPSFWRKLINTVDNALSSIKRYLPAGAKLVVAGGVLYIMYKGGRLIRASKWASRLGASLLEKRLRIRIEAKIDEFERAVNTAEQNDTSGDRIAWVSKTTPRGMLLNLSNTVLLPNGYRPKRLVVGGTTQSGELKYRDLIMNTDRNASGGLWEKYNGSVGSVIANIESREGILKATGGQMIKVNEILIQRVGFFNKKGAINDPFAAFKNCAAFLKRGGTMTIITGTKFQIYDNIIERALRDAGFKIDAIKPIGGDKWNKPGYLIKAVLK